MLDPSSTPINCIEMARIPGHERLYFVGPFCSRITFYSQQVRALQLAHALHVQNVIATNETVAVIGAGAAGITLATALALLDYDVHLYDRAADVLQLQSNSPRLLHPHIYEWPRLGSLDDRAGLPFLNWAGASGKDVVKSLRAQFHTLKVQLNPKLLFHPGHDLKSLVNESGEWTLTFETGTDQLVRTPSHVVLTMGFGAELPCGTVVPEDYWAQNAIGTSATEAIALNAVPYVVSGNGDGALTVALSLLIQDFEHDKFTRTFLDYFSNDRLRQAAEKAFAGKAFDEDAEADLRAYVLPVLSSYGAIDKLRAVLRTDRQVTVNAKGPLFAARRASQLNQCMVLALLEAASTTATPIVRSSGEVTACAVTEAGTVLSGTNISGDPDVTPYRHAIFRHGPGLFKRYEPLGMLFGAYKQYIDALKVSHPEQFKPPQLDDDTFDLFEDTRIERLLNGPAQTQAKAAAAQERRSTEVALDPAVHVLVERGAVSLGFLADQCERLPEQHFIDLHVTPKVIKGALDLVRLARCSEGRIMLRAAPDVLALWQDLSPQVMPAPPPSSPRALQEYKDSSVAHAIDASLVRRLDHEVQDVIQHGTAGPLGTISPQILTHVCETWTKWQSALAADHQLRHDFLRWLANVDQQPAKAWTGELGDRVVDMAGALILAAATHAGQSIVPCSDEAGNFGFQADSSSGQALALAIGSGCRVIGRKPLSALSTPDEWGVDALILSAVNDVVISAPAGNLLDAGTPVDTLKTPRRVAPAIIQTSAKWRSRLGGTLADWKTAVAAEFTEWRERQDEEVKRMAE